MYVLKIRIKFTKLGVMKFVGHLDIMRYFQKVMRRANIDIAYSEGFSPHQIMSFALPLGVGITSDGEYLDVEIKTKLTSQEAIKRLNETMAEGIEIVSFRQLSEDNKNAMSIVAAADYEITFREGSKPNADWENKINEFYDREEIIVTKTSKKSVKEVDIKPMIYAIAAKDGKVTMKIATGSVSNLKPELVMQAFCEYIGFEVKEFALIIHRKELFANMGDENNIELIALEEMGEDINE
ncbi:MAG: TIGR03936 family radical SAM-associated protein [Lachnotalea sp.]